MANEPDSPAHAKHVPCMALGSGRAQARVFGPPARLHCVVRSTCYEFLTHQYGGNRVLLQEREVLQTSIALESYFNSEDARLLGSQIEY